MARIRTIKPGFFRHEGLYEAERETGLPLRVAFVGLWTAADREGRFKWKPRELKLDALPFDEVDFSRVLDALLTRGHIVKYAIGDAVYGCIPSWSNHQIINNREAVSEIPPPLPTLEDFTRAARVDHATGTPLKQLQGEGKGREGERKEDMAETGQAGLPLSSPPADANGVQTSQPKDECPHQAIIALFHELLPMARRVRDWTPARASLLRARWREDKKRQSLDWWRKFFAYVAESNFLTGKATTPGRKPFELGLEWLLTAEKFAKVREGAYHEVEGQT
jgi:hypothetical protein